MPRPTETSTLHFDLSHGAEDTEYTLHACLKEYRLERHTPETLAEAKRTNRALAHAPAARVTHYVPDLELPADMPLMLMVTSPSKVGADLDTLEMTAIHIPRAARQRAIAAMRQQPAHPCHGQQHPKLQMFGFAEEHSEDDPIIIDVHDWKTAMDAAVSLITQHSELLNLDDDVEAVVTTHVEYANGISDLAASIYSQALAHQRNPTDSNNWVNPAEWLDPMNLEPMPGEPRYAWSEETLDWVPGPMTASLRTTKNAPDLESTDTRPGCWTVQPGAPSQGVPATDRDAATFAELLGLDATGWTINNLTSGHGLKVGDLKYTDPTVSVPLNNYWLRWLSVFAEFLNVDGEPFDPPDWTPIGEPDWDSKTDKYVDILSAVNTIMGVPLGGTFKDMTFPMPAEANSVRIKAGGLGRVNGIDGVGGWESDVCVQGTIMTSVFNLAIPVVAMIAGALISGSSLNYIAKAAYKELIVALRLYYSESAAASQLAHGSKGMWITLANSLIRAAITASPLLAAWIAAKISEGAVKKAVPVVGWIATAVSTAVDAALLTQTIVEVAESPATFILKAERKMDIQVNLAPDVKHQNQWPATATHYRVTAIYSPSNLQNGSTGRVYPALYEDSTPDFPLSPTTQEGPIQVTLKNVPWGGRVQIIAGFYSETNWLAGHWESSTLDALPTGPAANPPTLVLPLANITEELVPLDADTYYSPKQELAFSGGQRHWASGKFEITQDLPALLSALDSHQVTAGLAAAFQRDGGVTLSPEARIVTTRRGGDLKGTGWLIAQESGSFHVHLLTYGQGGQTVQKLSVAPGNAATRRDLDSSNVGDNLGQVVGITFNQETSSLGYTWQASGQDIPLDHGTEPYTGQMFTFQNIDSGQDPQSALRFVKSGYALKPYLVYDLFGPASGDGYHFIIDPRDEGYHLRKVNLSASGPFDPPPNQSWGRFNQQIDAAVIHPNGYVVGINTKNSKVEVLPVLRQPRSDADAPLANLYSGLGARAGLIHRPVGVTATADGTLLILEDASSNPPGSPQVQAFDYQLNPVFLFKSQDPGGGKSSSMPLRQEATGITYLDVAAESTGYIYVLKYLAKGDKVEDYRLDIYSPDGDFLSQSTGVNAARLAVTLWRNMFTLNFNILSGSGRTEPTVSQWIPSTPAGNLP